MDRLQAMTLFVAVVDAGGFAPAARALQVSPPIVTRAVADLEDRLGVRLLSRTTRVVRVTEAGARYAADCRRILGEIEDAEDLAGGTPSAPAGRLCLTSPVLFGRAYVMPIVTQYLQQHPQVEADCLFVDRVVNMTDEGMDVAVRIGDLPDSSLQAIRVGSVRRVIVAAPDYLARAGTPSHPDDLDGHTLVSTSGGTTSVDWRLQDGGRPLHCRLKARLTTSNNDSAIEAARRGFGLTRVLSYQVAALVEAGALVPLLQDFAPEPLPISVVHREGRLATHKVRAFLDLAIATLRADPSLRG
jgi:DNA-binding transcriptional LysR family regulator